MIAAITFQASRVVALKPLRCGNVFHRYNEGGSERLEWMSSLDCPQVVNLQETMAVVGIWVAQARPR